ncbi:MAG: hypothetical protein M3Z50_05215 [Actinomycetota bacterium]|nr:hypothetical protein [Actinomycetota bacterium]
MTREQEEYAALVRAWSDRLREGEPITWNDFVAGEVAPLTFPTDGPLPNTAQLELVRRLAALRPPEFTGLADLVLATPLPGRGRVDVPLALAGHRPGFGTPSADPVELDPEELLRVCCGVLTTLLPGIPSLTPQRLPRNRPGLALRGRFSLAGWPDARAAVRRGLLDAGLREGGRRAVTVVLAGPLEAMMAGHWAVRTRTGGSVTWAQLWRRCQARDRLPPAVAVDLAVARFGDAQVVVAADPARALAATARVLGVTASAEPTGLTPVQSAECSDLLRRLNPVLGFTTDPAGQAVLPRRLTGLVPDLGTARLGPPAAQLDWAQAQGWRIAETLAVTVRRVHGDPGVVVPSGEVRRSVAAADTLELAVTACARAWNRIVDRRES